MATGFKNSAGTDLSDIFYTDNGNAGAIGLKQADGKDLGNLFTNASTLGYAVGYKNSAGTDLGYLRGAIAIPSISSSSVTVTSKTNTTYALYDEYEDSEGSVSTTRDGNGKESKAVLTFAVKSNLSIKQKLQIRAQIVYSIGTNSQFYALGFKAGATSVPNDLVYRLENYAYRQVYDTALSKYVTVTNQFTQFSKGSTKLYAVYLSGTSNLGGQPSSPGPSNWLTLYDGEATGSNLSTTVALYISLVRHNNSSFDDNPILSGSTSNGLMIQQRIGTSAGWSAWTASQRVDLGI